MRDKTAARVISPDGRFEVITEEKEDDDGRGHIYNYYETCLVERATGERIFDCGGEPRAEFALDGILTLHYPDYRPFKTLQINPASRVFRADPSDPWIPVAAWRIVTFAYWRGSEQGKKDIAMSQEPTPFPWVAITLLLGSIAAVAALSAQTFLSIAKTDTLMVIAAIGVLFFGWLTASDVSARARERMREREHARSPGAVGGSSRPE